MNQTNLRKRLRPCRLSERLRTPVQLADPVPPTPESFATVRSSSRGSVVVDHVDRAVRVLRNGLHDAQLPVAVEVVRRKDAFGIG
jgi:hypothetical protein